MMLLTDRAKAFAELGRIYQESRDFAETLTVTDPEVLGEVRSLLDEEVGGMIQRVFDLTIDPATNTFRGKAEQKLSLAKSQFYQFTMSPTSWDYKLIPVQSVNPQMSEFNENDDEDWAGAIAFAASKSPRAAKKLNCKPGNTQCGGKCQDGKKNCKYTPTPDQAKAVETVAVKAKSKAKPKKHAAAAKPAPAAKADSKPAKIKYPKIINGDEVTDFSQDVAVGKVKASIEGFATLLNQAKGFEGSKEELTTLEVAFYVNDSLGKGEIADTREAVKTALGIRQNLQQYIASLPTGLVVSCTPYTEDGSGAARARLYKKSGFGEVDSEGRQWGIMQKGKILPISDADLKKLTKAKR
ncbi:MAG TPA: hypothetical protein V6C57_13085 [Coleofasciculaceae cyanobacterium]